MYYVLCKIIGFCRNTWEMRGYVQAEKNIWWLDICDNFSQVFNMFATTRHTCVTLLITHIFVQVDYQLSVIDYLYYQLLLLMLITLICVLYVYKRMICDILLCKIMLQEKHSESFSNLNKHVKCRFLKSRLKYSRFVFACFFLFSA